MRRFRVALAALVAMLAWSGAATAVIGSRYAVESDMHTGLWVFRVR